MGIIGFPSSDSTAEQIQACCLLIKGYLLSSSGKNPFQESQDFLSRVKLRKRRKICSFPIASRIVKLFLQLFPLLACPCVLPSFPPSVQTLLGEVWCPM